MANNVDPYILVLNCGSSSLKFAVIHAQSGAKQLSGLAEKLTSDKAVIHFKHQAKKDTQALSGPGHLPALRAIFEYLDNMGIKPDDLLGVGHRVVHGGEAFVASTVIDESVLEGIKACSDLAPLHNPANILGIETVSALFPKLPQVAVFDTAFHQSMPEHVYLYPVPYEWYTEKKVRRYGFHGSSHRYVAKKAYQHPNVNPQAKIISAHLGNGCSACAIKEGQSVDTTMGLTPLEGLMMGTRCGNIDPALPQFICEAYGQSIDEVMNHLNKQSGLLGISGQTNDMRTIEDLYQQQDKRCTLAFTMFCYRLAKQIAGLAVSLGGVDVLIFTGGIGENSVLVREQVIQQLSFLGFNLDAAANENHGRNQEGVITQGEPLGLVIPTDEEWMITQDSYELIRAKERA